jgi:hypothetical protein
MDRKPYCFNFQLSVLPPLKYFWWFAILLHIISYAYVLWKGNFLLNDSVIYLTMAENYQKYGIISQSFYPPFLPDFQRSPLYSFLISFIPISWVLFIQHLMILISGYFIQKLSFRYSNEPNVLHYLGVFFSLCPYSINLASLIMTETLFIFLLTAFGSFFLLFIEKKSWKYLFFLTFFFILACYTRASALPMIFWVTIAIFWISRSIFKSVVFMWCTFIGLIPWIYRNQVYTGKWFFTSMSEISTHYGRIGGTALAFNKEMKLDPFLKVEADFYVSQQYPLEKMKSYFQNHVLEETEFLNFPYTWIYFKQNLEMPLHAMVYQIRCFFQQMTGVSYGMSVHLYSNKALAWLMGGFQMIFIIFIYFFYLRLILKNRSSLAWLWLISIIFWLIIHNAAWADGRYRYPTDLWCILGILVLDKK